MIDVAARHGVKAQTENFPMRRVKEAIDKVKKNKVRYRAVLANKSNPQARSRRTLDGK